MVYLCFAADKKEHDEVYCHRRLLSCPLAGCSDSVAADEMQQHVEFDCSWRPRPCPRGCGEIIPPIEAGAHEASSCSRRDVCKLADVISHLSANTSALFVLLINLCVDTLHIGL